MEKILLEPTDLVGVTFWLISAAMVSATFFFWVERDRAVGKWKTSLTLAAMRARKSVYSTVRSSSKLR